MGMILSPKFNRKLNWIACLEELSKCLPLRDLGIPDNIFEFNSKLGLDIQKNHTGVFGISLKALQGDVLQVPAIMRICGEYINEKGTFC
jgi:hypothetical protein